MHAGIGLLTTTWSTIALTRSFSVQYCLDSIMLKDPRYRKFDFNPELAVCQLDMALNLLRAGVDPSAEHHARSCTTLRLSAPH